MDAEERRLIDEMIGVFIKNLSLKKSAVTITSWFEKDVLLGDTALDWIMKDPKEQTSELTTGYVIGFLVCQAQETLQQIRVRKEISKWSTNEVKIVFESKSEQKPETTYIRINSKDIKDIKEIIKPKIPTIRTEVYRALSV